MKICKDQLNPEQGEPLVQFAYIHILNGYAHV